MPLNFVESSNSLTINVCVIISMLTAVLQRDRPNDYENCYNCYNNEKGLSTNKCIAQTTWSNCTL